MYKTLMENISTYHLGIRCMSNDSLSALIACLYRHELTLKNPHKSVVILNEHISVHGITADLFPLINKLKAEEQAEDDEYRRIHPIDYSMMAKAPPYPYKKHGLRSTPVPWVSISPGTVLSSTVNSESQQPKLDRKRIVTPNPFDILNIKPPTEPFTGFDQKPTPVDRQQHN